VYEARVRAVAGAAAGPFTQYVRIPVSGGTLAAPTSFTASVNGNAVLLSWNLASTAGLTGLVLEALSGPGGVVVQQFPITVSTSTSLTLPTGAYTVRLRSVGAGTSGPSNEVSFTAPSCSPGASIPLSVSSLYGHATVSWPRVPGALSYTISASENGVPKLSAPLAATTTFVSSPVAAANYAVTLTANVGACGSLAGSLAFTASNNPPPGPRGAAGLGLGVTTGMVASAANAIAAQYPGALARSCGNNEWLFRLLQRLRQQDNRFGLNWKRGVVGDPSQDVITYNFSNVPDNQATAAHIYAWDTISNHCGSNPVPNAANITNSNGQAGWTVLPYLQAGFTP